MKKKTKLISMILAIILCLSCAVIPVFADHPPFTDVPNNAWFARGVNYVYHNGLMTGVSGNKFAPNNSMNRAMVVTVLWRMGGSVEPTIDNPFVDVNETDWCAKPVLWAYEVGITDGTSVNTFSPNRYITREQLVTFFYRFAEHEGIDISHRADLGIYSDANDVAVYAKDAFSWAVKNGIVEGTNDTTLSPTATATRAQCAVVLMRLDSLMKDYEGHICTHDNTSYYTVQEATCSKRGASEVVCDYCGEVLRYDVTPLKNCTAWSEWKTETEATPTKPGTKVKVCKECGKKDYKYYDYVFPQMVSLNSIYIPGTGINHSIATIDYFSQEDVNRNDMVYGRLYPFTTNGPWLLGHNYGTLGKLSKTKVGQNIFISVNGEIKVYEVVVSEYALQNATWSDIVGQTSGLSIFHEYEKETLHMYTCHTAQNRNGRWMVLATLVE